MSKWINIKVNADNGEAKVVLTDAFFEMNTLWQADILKDCSGYMDKLYAEALERWDGENEKRLNAEGHRIAKNLVSKLNSE